MSRDFRRVTARARKIEIDETGRCQKKSCMLTWPKQLLYSIFVLVSTVNPDLILASLQAAREEAVHEVKRA